MGSRHPAGLHVSGFVSPRLSMRPVYGIVGGLVGFGVGAWGSHEFWNGYNSESSEGKSKESDGFKEPKKFPKNAGKDGRVRKKVGLMKMLMFGCQLEEKLLMVVSTGMFNLL